jgi:hypothetical protein
MYNCLISGLGLQATITERLEELDSQEEEEEEEVDEDEDEDDDEEEEEEDDDDDEEGIIVEFCQEDILEEVLEHAVNSSDSY